jgi:hypothetical protein
MKDQRAGYFRGLDESGRPRIYLRAPDPEDERTQWLFEAVEDDGRRIAIKQIEARSSGEIHRYWWRHLEDEHGFLTDQPLDDGEVFWKSHAREFRRMWDS